MPCDDFKFGDSLDFKDNSHLEHGGGSYTIQCLACGKTRFICGKCLESGSDECQCVKHLRKK